MTPRGAAAWLVRLDDLPPGPWLELPADAPNAPAGGSGEELLLACLGDDLADLSVRDAADSSRFVRPAAAMVFATSFQLTDSHAAASLAERVASSEFALAFAASVVADAAHVGPGGREVIDLRLHPSEPDLPHAGVHRVSITGADQAGLVPVHIDLAVLARGDALVLVWLADTPEPFPDVERSHVLTRVAARLPR